MSVRAIATATLLACAAAASPAVYAMLCPLPGIPPSTSDIDADGILDYCDNCVELPNPMQEDSDADGAGNRCDGDLDNSGFVNYKDLGLLSAALVVFDAQADFDSNTSVNLDDVAIFRDLFGTSPGPTGRTLDLGNTAPAVATSVPATALTGSTVELDASGSTDADLDPLLYKWSLIATPAGSTSALTDAELEVAALVPDVEGQYQLQVAVSDASATTISNLSLEAYDPLVCSGVVLDDPLAQNIIEITGTGLGHAGVSVTLDGTQATILERTAERLVMQMPATLPAQVVLNRAEDGLTTTCDSVAMSPLANTDIFIAVDAAGNLVDSGRVVVGADNTTLEPFLFRPDGELSLGLRSGLELYFPAGATIVERNGEYFIAFTAVTIKRGAYDNAPVELTFGQTQEISVASLDSDGIRTLLGLAPGDQLPVYLTPTLTLDWQGGSIDRNGSSTALFVPVTSQLGALPFADMPVTVTPLKRADSDEPLYMIAYYGLFSMNGVTLEIPRQRPWAFIFHADGKLELSGEARFTMPNGASFRGSVEFLGGRITIDIGARKLHFDALASLAELLPPDPAACVPATADDQQMNIAASCLEAFTHSYQHFAVGAVQLDDIDFERDLVPLVTPEVTVIDAFEAMTWRAFAQVSANGIPGLTQPFIDQLAIITGNAAKALQSEYTLPDAIAWNNALLRLKAAVESGNPGFTGDFLDLNVRRSEAEQAVIDAITHRLNTSDDLELLNSLQEVARAILDGEAERQLSGGNLNSEAILLVKDYLSAFSAKYLTEHLGILPGETDPVLNDKVLGLDKNASLIVIHNLLELMASMQELEFNWQAQANPVLPFDEAIAQLLTHIEDLQVQELTTTGGAFRTNPELLKILLRDRLDLAASMAMLGYDEQSSQHVYNASVLMDWEAFEAEILSKPGYSATRIDWFIETLELLEYILDQIPPGTASYPGFNLADIDYLIEEFIKRAPFDKSTEPRDWVTFLSGGIRGDRIGRNYLTSKFAIDPAGDANLIKLVRGLVTLSGGDAGSTASPQFAHLDEAARLLQKEIRELETEITDPALSPEQRDARRQVRLAYLQALGELAMGYQRVAQRLYAQGAASFGSLAFVQDLLLPGDIRVHEIAAAASLDINTGQFGGRFSGMLEMPRFSTLLTVSNASFDSFGTFDLAAFGQTSFPGQPQAGSNAVTLVIPQRRPISLSVRPGGSFAISGGADLRLPGGTTIGGYLSIEDPEYVFELAFGGKIRLDLINEMSIAYPVLDINSVEFNNLGIEASRQLTSFYTSFGLSLEGVVKDFTPLPPIIVTDPGEPPEFTTPVTTIPLQSLDAMLTGFVNDEVITRLNGVSGMIAGLREHLITMKEELKEATDNLQLRFDNFDRLRERAQVMERAHFAIQLAELKQLIAGEDAADLLAIVTDMADKNADLSIQYVTSLPPDATPQMRLAAISAAVDAVATAQLTGSVEYEAYQPDFIQPQIDNVMNFYLGPAGLALDSSIVDQEKFNNTSDATLLAIAKYQLEMAGYLGDSGFVDDSGQYAIAAIETMQLIRNRKLDRYAELSNRHDADAILERSQLVAWLLRISDELSIMTGSGLELPPGVELVVAENGIYLSDTIEELQQQAGASATNVTDSQKRFAIDIFATDLFNVDQQYETACKLKLEWLGRSKDKGECTKSKKDDGTYADNSVKLKTFWATEIDLNWMDVLQTNMGLLLENNLLNPGNELVIKDGIRGWATAYAQAVETRYGMEPVIQENQIKQVYGTMQTLLYGIGFLGDLLPEEQLLIDQWQARLQDLHVPWLGAAEAAKALWYIGAYANNIAFVSATYDASLSLETKSAFAAAARDGVASMQSIVVILSQALASVDTSSFTLKLPGDLQLERFFGRLEFNRETIEWLVAFGGSVRFPEVNLAFAVTNASMASNGDFSMGLMTSGPVPLDLLNFGIAENFDLDIQNAFQLSGNVLAPSINQASAEANLTRKLDGGGIENYSAAISYQYTPQAGTDPSQHHFGIAAEAAGGVLSFTDDLHIFRSGFAFDLDAIDQAGIWLPQQAGVSISSHVGIMAKTSPLPVPATINDFHLVFEGDAGVEVATDTTRIYLGPGRLNLPDGFQAKNCDPAITPSGMPAVPQPRKNLEFTGPVPFTLMFRHANFAADPNLANTLDIAINGTLSFDNVGFGIGEVNGLWADVCELQLNIAFDSNARRPSVTVANLNSRVSLPMPGGQPLVTGLKTENWSLDRLPSSGRIFLAEDLTVFDLGGLTVKALRDQQQPPRPGTYIELFTDHPNIDLPRGPGFTVAGRFNAQASGWFKDRAGNAQQFISSEAAGAISVVPPANLQTMSLSNFYVQLPLISFGAMGEFFIGDSVGTGIAVVDPAIRIDNLLNAFEPTPATPFKVGVDIGLRILTGQQDAQNNPYAVEVSGKRMEVIFDGSPSAPLVDFGVLAGCLSIGEGTTAPLIDGLPLYLNKLCIAFNSIGGPVPLFTPGLPTFGTDNVSITVSGGMALPPQGDPIVTGALQDATVGFANSLPELKVDGLGLGVDMSQYLGDVFPLGGQVFIGGIQTGDYYFSGLLKGNIKGNMVEGIAAFGMDGLRGLCFGLSGAEISIPIGYGFVMTGGRGGLALGSGNVDPCDFVSLMNINPITGSPDYCVDNKLPDGSPCTVPSPPGGTTAQACAAPVATLADLPTLNDPLLEDVALNLERVELAQRMISEQGADSETALAEVGAMDQAAIDSSNQAIDADTARPGAFCPSRGSCPPASLGILAQPHPEAFDPASPHAGRAIIKFTSIDEATLNLWGFNRALVASALPTDIGISLSLSETERQLFAAEVARRLRAYVEEAIPKPPASANPPAWVNDFYTQLNELTDNIQVGFYNQLNDGLCTITAFGDRNGDGTTDINDVVEAVYGYVRDTAYAGVPYSDLTFRLEGSFSYTGISSFASITGGAIVSTSGSSGIVGSINMLGIPTGTLAAFVNQTDANGNPSPSICGSMNFAIGPLEIGSAELLADCPDCAQNFFDAMGNLANALTAPYVYSIMEEVSPGLASSDTQPVTEQLALLGSDEQKLAFMAEMFNKPPAPDQQATAGAFKDFMVSLADAVSPRLAACGEVKPKLFGFTPAGDNAVFGTRNYYGHVDPANPAAGIRLLSEFQLSPLQLVGKTILVAAGPFIDFIPSIDQASVAVTYKVNSLGQVIDDALTLPPVEYLNARVADFVDNATMTMAYELSPLGMELGRSAGRLLFPSYTAHPAKPGVSWTPPEDRGLPSRLELLLAMLGDINAQNSMNVLADPLWEGSAQNMADLFPAGSYSFSGNETLVDDFFPYGGFIGASTVSIPKLLSQGLDGMCTIDVGGKQTPCAWVIPDGSVDPSIRLQAAFDFFGAAGSSETVSRFGFYIPAPNPPQVLAGGFPTDLQDLFNSFGSFDAANHAALYPIQEAFMTAESDVTILGLPTTRTRLNLNLDLLSPNSGLFEFIAQVPDDSWLAALASGLPTRPCFDDPLADCATVMLTMESGAQAVDTVANTTAQLRDEAQALIGAAPELIDAYLADAIEAMTLKLPRGKIEMTLNQFHLPLPGVTNWTAWNTADAGLTLNNVTFAAYTPRYDPAHTVTTLFDTIVRDGGMGLTGSMDFNQGGLQLTGATGSMLVSPQSNAFGMPTFRGEFTASNFTMNGLTPVTAGNIDVSVTASPTSLDIATSAAVSSLPLGDATLKSTTLFGTFNVSGSLTADATTGYGNAAFQIGPALLTHPAFGKNTRVVVNLDVATNEAWGPTSVIIENPELVFDVGGETWLSVSFPVATIPATISGNGAQITSINIGNLPTGAIVTTFPGSGDVREQTITVGTNGTASLSFGVNGNFQLSASGTTNVVLAGFPGATMSAGYAMQLSNTGFQMSGTINRLGISGLAMLKPRSGDVDGLLDMSISSNTAGNITATMEPAAIEINTPALQSEVLIDGGTYLVGKEVRIADLSISTSGNWNARVVVNSLTLDPDGSGALPEFMQVIPVSSNPPAPPPALFTMTANFNGLSDFSFSATRSGLVELKLLYGTILARGLTINPGTQSISFDSTAGFQFVLDGLSPGDVGSTFSMGSLPGGATLFEASPASSSKISVKDDGLRIELGTPSIKLAGVPLPLVDTYLGFYVSNSGGFTGLMWNFATMDLFGPMLQLLPATHLLSGTIGNLPTTLSLSAKGNIHLAVPGLSASGTTITLDYLDYPFDLNLNANQAWSYTWTPATDSPTGQNTGFDIGWADFEAGANGKVLLGLSNNTFTFAVQNWDMWLFGTKFNDAVDFTLSTNGQINMSLPAGIFNFGSGLNWVRLNTNTSFPFALDFRYGTVNIDFPNTGLLSLPGFGLLSGTLLSGIDILDVIDPLANSGTWDNDNASWSRTITINGVNFGSCSVSFNRRVLNGPVTFYVSSSGGVGSGLASVNLNASVSTDGGSSIRLVGSVGVPNVFGLWSQYDTNGDGIITVGSLSLQLQASSTVQFKGTGLIYNPATRLYDRFNVELGTSGSKVTLSGWPDLPIPYTLPQ